MGKCIRNREMAINLEQGARELSGVIGKVGFFETAKYPDGTPVAEIAAVQELGYPKGGIPPRPFMRTAAAEHGKEWKESFAKGAKAIANGRFTAHQVMDAVGQAAAGDIRKKISTITTPPLKASTVAARRRRYKDKKTTGNLSKPLVDTAVMVNSVTNAVEDKA